MNDFQQIKVNKNNKLEFLSILNSFHVRSGLSLREVAQLSDLDYSYVCRILNGSRKPSRDVIIALGLTYNLERVEVDEILLLSGYPPIGRGLLRDYRQTNIRKS